MTRQFFAGGTYADATPDGAYAALVGLALQTHRGPVALPPGEDALLFVRITTVGGFQIAGKAHNAAQTWQWQGETWRALPDGIGVSPLIFDRLGLLHISDGSIGSQGWRYVEDNGTPAGRLVTGDETYGSTVGLSEWSAYGGLQIGQGHDVGGVCVWDGLRLRMLEAGDCRFIRVQGDGQAVAVSFWKVGQGAVVYQTTLADLRGLPPAPVAPIPPTPQPVPPIQPVPVPPKPVPPKPEPPKPEPPQPHPPQETAMIAYAPPVPGFKPGDLHDNGNGTVSVQKPNGKWVCVTPDGAVEERDTPGGAWESFTRGKTSLLASRDPGRVYVLPLAE